MDTPNETYNKGGKSSTKNETIDTEDPNVILSFNNPFRQCNSHRYVLTSIRMAIFFEVFSNGLICESSNSNIEYLCMGSYGDG